MKQICEKIIGVGGMISVVIRNRNEQDYIGFAIQSVVDHLIDYEIIVVDNNSTDGSIELVTKTYPSIILLKLNSNKGFAEPNNIGAKIANGKYLLFLNNDTIVTPSFISEMVQVIENDKKIAICQSLLLKPDESVDSSGDFIDPLGVVYNSTKKTDEIRLESHILKVGGSLPGSNLMSKSEVESQQRSA